MLKYFEHIRQCIGSTRILRRTTLACSKNHFPLVVVSLDCFKTFQLYYNSCGWSDCVWPDSKVLVKRSVLTTQTSCSSSPFNAATSHSSSSACPLPRQMETSTIETYVVQRRVQIPPHTAGWMSPCMGRPWWELHAILSRKASDSDKVLWWCLWETSILMAERILSLSMVILPLRRTSSRFY